MSETKRRANTLEFKLEAVRLVKGKQAASVTAKILGIPKASLENWVRLSARGELKGAGDKPVNPEQMELVRLRAELARVKMERDILKKATAYFARESQAHHGYLFATARASRIKLLVHDGFGVWCAARRLT